LNDYDKIKDALCIFILLHFIKKERTYQQMKTETILFLDEKKTKNNKFF